MYEIYDLFLPYIHCYKLKEKRLEFKGLLQLWAGYYNSKKTYYYMAAWYYHFFLAFKKICIYLVSLKEKYLPSSGLLPKCLNQQWRSQAESAIRKSVPGFPWGAVPQPFEMLLPAGEGVWAGPMHCSRAAAIPGDKSMAAPKSCPLVVLSAIVWRLSEHASSTLVK